MQTIELVGDKSTVRLDVDEWSHPAFVAFAGNFYFQKEAGSLVYEQTDGDPPSMATVVHVGPDWKFTEHKPLDPAPTDEPNTATHEGGPDAADHPKTV